MGGTTPRKTSDHRPRPRASRRRPPRAPPRALPRSALLSLPGGRRAAGGRGGLRRGRPSRGGLRFRVRRPPARSRLTGAGETNAADEGVLESTAPQAATPADREYAPSGAGGDRPAPPETQGTETPTPGVRRPETGELTPPADGAPPAGGLEAALGAAPAASPSASPNATPSAAPSASPSASPEASPEPKITLPETGGPPLLLLAAALLPGLFPAGLLVRAGCRRASEAGRRRETGGL